MKEFLLKCFIVLACIIVPWLLVYFSYFFYQHKIKKRHLPKVAKRPKKKSILKRIYIDFPVMAVKDRFNRKDMEFRDSGLHLICGEQGAGKTVLVAYMLRQYQKQYPLLQVRTNFGYTLQNGEIKSWRDLVFKNNGIHGEIDVIDEIQNWFNSLESKNFPVEMFSEISQQRKQRKMIIGTSQVWSRVAKPLREQTKLLYEPLTLGGCLTIVRVSKPVLDETGTCTKKNLRRIFFFVHDDELRNIYDTYHKIQTMSLKGFKTSTEQMAYRNSSVSVISNESNN